MKTDLKASFLTTVSVAVLVAFGPVARASDLPAQAVEPIVYAGSPNWTIYGEVGAFFTSGDRIYQGFPFNDVVSPIPNLRAEGAVGIDYRLPDSMWHFSIDLRYGAASQSDQHGAIDEAFVPVPVITAGGLGTATDPTGIWAGTAKVVESHVVADFMVGRDLGIGSDTQIKLGLRIAELRSKTTGPGIAFAGTSLTSVTSTDTTELKSRFFGLGPRIALTGNMPLAGAWGFDYSAGAAYLFAKDQSAKFLTTDDGMIEREDNQSVVNIDGSLAVAYNFSQDAKLSIGYRADAYFDALPGLNFSKVAGESSSTRVYHGAFLRLTYRF